MRVGELIASERDHHHRSTCGEALLNGVVAAVRDDGVDAPDETSAVRFMDASTISYLEAFREADTPFEGLGDTLSARAGRRSGAIGRQAYFFLSEPLYRLASFYTVRDWAMWPLCSHEDEPDLTESGWRLFKGGWVPGLDANGLFLYRLPDER